MHRLLVTALLAWTGLLCGCPEAPSDTSDSESTAGGGPLLLIGIDGLEWDVLLELLAEDRLRALAGLMERGTFGLLETFEPTDSPVIWTSIATGKTVEKHGIDDFVVMLDDERWRLIMSGDRRTKAVWNILSDYDRTVCTLGWWATYPVEAVNGVMVSQANTADRFRRISKGTLVEGLPEQVYPALRQDEIMSIRHEVDGSLVELLPRIFGRLPSSPDPLGRELMTATEWAFRADATYHRIGVELVRERPPFDASLVYLGGPDVVGHRFWRYLQPELYTVRPGSEELQNYGRIITDYYTYVDGVVSDLIGAAPPDSTVLIVSDHGMHAENVEGSFDLNDGFYAILSGHHRDAPAGVLIAAGPHIRRAARGKPLSEYRREDLATIGSVMDITPTILAMFRIPRGADMDGRVLDHLFTPDFHVEDQPEAIATHDDARFLASRRTPVSADPGQAERIEQLQSLGYLDGTDNEGD